MTQIEKQTVEKALIEYAMKHKDSSDGNVAAAILTYWKDVVEAKSGTATI